MADVALRYVSNAPGTFYVDHQCIDCDLCREIAPVGFTRDDDACHSFVHRQPAAGEDDGPWRQAMASCPVDAIGDDGG